VPVRQPTTRPSRSTLVLASGLLIVSLSACRGAASVSEPPLDREHQQAQDALTRWADAVAAAGGQQGFVIVRDATGQIGDWEIQLGSDGKLALIAGKVVAAVELSDEIPAAAEAHWEDGSVQLLPLVSAAQALEDLQAAGGQACPDCDALKVTGAKLTTVQIETGRGPATVPAWDFSLQGTAVHVTRVAVSAQANISVSPPAWDPNNPPVGQSIESASGSVGGRELTVSFIGARGPGSQPCGADYDAEAVESETAVVVIIIEHNNPTPVACAAIGALRTATVRLAAPLGDRAVLEVVQGLPVPVTLAP
jgi:hypothetical protein